MNMPSSEAERNGAQIMRAFGYSPSAIAKLFGRGLVSIQVWTSRRINAYYKKDLAWKRKQRAKFKRKRMTPEQVKARRKLREIAKRDSIEFGLPIREAYKRYGLTYYNERA